MTRLLYSWRLRTRNLDLGRRTVIMGILNVTPDSFSDGGKFFSCERAVSHGLQMLEAGAELLDIGGESTRPGSNLSQSAVPADEEMRRIMPVIADLLSERPDAILSVDTYKAEVARAALDAGVEIVNDVSALRWDSRMAATVAEFRCGVVLMHTRGRPEDWRALPPSPDIIAEELTDFHDWTNFATAKGVERDRIVLDPGFGFGKKFEANYPLLAGLSRLQELGFPILAGTSRKSFVGRTLARQGQDAPVGERIYGSLASMTAAILQGAHIVRVHDVKPAVDAARVADEVLSFS